MFDIDFGGMFDTVGEYASKAFDWMEANQTAAGAIAGLAGAGLNYMASQDEIEAADRRLQKQLEQQARFNERRPSSGNENYASHVQSLTGGTGLLKRGQLV
jgi:hypothetical protein